MRRKIVTYLCYMAILLSSVTAFAKKDPPPPQSQPPPPGLPIDGGISLFLIVGAAYGVYAIKKNTKINKF